MLFAMVFFRLTRASYLYAKGERLVQVAHGIKRRPGGAMPLTMKDIVLGTFSHFSRKSANELIADGKIYISEAERLVPDIATRRRTSAW